ncbi:MAG: hypothetical protein HUU09_09105 [Candidatus Jettenia caeni]|uniref:hypothetical protein n=1 Tax=Candidatus Jettenia sp. AMX1 TaxID=2293637 RepID=UPI0017F9D386|nr:hypothetical protein [Candidatus Jettenia sp. AMX1]MDL1940189.1 hypothetical protein [Candidatus Jettenia sp. AMX1]NUN23611.1 hypothetical protein [Candidatus Jettenia caeni]
MPQQNHTRKKYFVNNKDLTPCLSATFEKILLVFAGWFLGLLSPIIVDFTKRKQERQEIKTALTTELQALRFHLLAMVYLIAHKKGIYDRQLLKWIQSNMISYTGIHRDVTLLNAIESLLKLTDQELSTVAALTKKQEDSGLSLKKHTTPLLDSRISRLSVLDELSRQFIFEIRTQLFLVNEEIDQYRFYFNQTFSSSISAKNYEQIVKNINESYVNISDQARLTVDRIGDLLSKWRC